MYTIHRLRFRSCKIGIDTASRYEMHRQTHSRTQTPSNNITFKSNCCIQWQRNKMRITFKIIDCVKSEISVHLSYHSFSLRFFPFFLYLSSVNVCFFLTSYFMYWPSIWFTTHGAYTLMTLHRDWNKNVLKSQELMYTQIHLSQPTRQPNAFVSFFFLSSSSIQCNWSLVTISMKIGNGLYQQNREWWTLNH